MSPRRSKQTSRTPLAALAGFAAGITVTVVLLWGGAAGAPRPAAPGEDCGQAVLDNADATLTRAPASRRAIAARAAVDAPEAADPAPPRIGGDPMADLRRRDLLIPVEGYASAALRSSFDEPRGGNRVHEAMDLLAPRHTAVLAVEDGTVARLFTSKAGGLTIYQFDPSTSFVYYYAHLERYAPGLRDGAALRRGQVIGYVGTSGNAPENTPHLHFAIYRLTEPKRWWEGAPVDPYEVLR
jgi:murein DD-endopeptidase MepM/ murein hydrolase activator NlpD